MWTTFPSALDPPSEDNSPKKFTFAKRLDYGKLGRPIEIFVNYFMLNYKDKEIYHYYVDICDANRDNTRERSLMSQKRSAKIDREKDVKNIERERRRNIGKEKCRLIVSEMTKCKRLREYCPVYDGQRNLYTSKQLLYKDEVSFPIDVVIDGKSKRFFVTIKPVKKEDGTNMISVKHLKNLYTKDSTKIPHEVLSVYETVLNHREPPFQQIHYRSSFFSFQRENVLPLGCGLEICFGYFKSVQLTELGPVLIINRTAKAFHKACPIIDYVNDILKHKYSPARFTDITKIRRLENEDIKEISEALRDVRVKVTYQRQPRRYKIISLTEQSAEELTFVEDRKLMSVVEYFWKKYGEMLRYPHLPCLAMKGGKSTPYIPMEMCVVLEGQPKIGKLNSNVSSTMVRKTAILPKERFDSIAKDAKQVESISKDYMNAFGLIVDLSFVKVDARIIASPQLEYGGDEKSRIARPNNKGVWRIDDGKMFYKVINVQNWVVISFANQRYCGESELHKFCDYLIRSARKCGMNLKRPNYVRSYNRNTSIEEAIIEAKKLEAKFAIVVLNRHDRFHTYDKVKFLADFVHNFVTQCMEDKTLKRINDQITTNVCLKINVKLGGINHILFQRPQYLTEPVIVVGVDVIHWPRHYGYPSILSVVGSVDQMASRYALTCNLQKNSHGSKLAQEIIEDMHAVSKEILEMFRDTNCWTNGIHPNKIIVFRDGLSEGQFQHALEYEVAGIQEASRDLFQKVIPITYIVVQKRHQTRFRPVNPARDVGSGQNVPSGTTADRNITHPVYFDFYQVSHDGIQGTSRPAHYTVLHNDNNFNADDLQQLSHFLCHTYVRCTRSVSIPAPVLYADLAAYRAKKYADLHIPPISELRKESENCQRDLPPAAAEAIRSMKSFPNNMFYV